MQPWITACVHWFLTVSCCVVQHASAGQTMVHLPQTMVTVDKTRSQATKGWKHPYNESTLWCKSYKQPNKYSCSKINECSNWRKTKIRTRQTNCKQAAILIISGVSDLHVMSYEGKLGKHVTQNRVTTGPNHGLKNGLSTHRKYQTLWG